MPRVLECGRGVYVGSWCGCGVYVGSWCGRGVYMLDPGVGMVYMLDLGGVGVVYATSSQCGRGHHDPPSLPPPC